MPRPTADRRRTDPLRRPARLTAAATALLLAAAAGVLSADAARTTLAAVAADPYPFGVVALGGVVLGVAAALPALAVVAAVRLVDRA